MANILVTGGVEKMKLVPSRAKPITTRGRTVLKLAERAAIRAANASIGDTKKPK